MTERRRRRNDFPEGVKKDVRFEQESTCADCGAYCNGHPASPRFTVHHVLPQSLGGSTDRKNAVGLCPKCHERHDAAALCGGKLFYETLIEEDRVPEAKVLAIQAGISIRALLNPDKLRSELQKPESPSQKPYQTVIFEAVSASGGEGVDNKG